MAEPYLTNLKMQTTEFIGRETELAEIINYLSLGTGRLMTLTGPGGVGKTRLSVQAGLVLQEYFSDGVYQVSLAAIRDKELIVSTIAHILDINQTGRASLLDNLKEFLANRRLLLILDNFEHLREARDVVADLLENTAFLKILVTSRIVLSLPGEEVLPLAPFATPDLKDLPDLNTVSLMPSVALFLQRASLIAPDFKLTQQNCATIAAICLKLDGLPLALELASARLKVLSPDQLLARLGKRFTILTGGSDKQTGQLGSLRRTIDWSFELLEQGQKQLLARLAVFQNGWSLEVAGQVCHTTDSSSDLAQEIAALYENSLIQPTSDHQRYTMLESIREYAFEILVKNGEEAITRQRHLNYFRSLVEQAEPNLIGSEQVRWFKILELEYDNIREGLSWAMAHDLPAALQIAGAIWRFWENYGYIAEGRYFLEKCLSAQGKVYDLEADLSEQDKTLLALRAKALNAAGVLARDQTDLAVAQAVLEEGITLLRKLGDRKKLSSLLNTLASVLSTRGEYRQALELHRENLALWQESPDKRSEAVTLGQLAVLMNQLGEIDDLRPHYEKPIALFREINDSRGLALMLNNYGEYLRSRGDHIEASKLILEGFAIRQRMGDRNGMIASLISMGDISYAENNLTQAVDYYRQGLKLLETVKDGRQTAMCLEGMANVTAKTGQPSEAARLMGAAAALRERHSCPPDAADRLAYQRALDSIRAMQAVSDFELAWALGQNLPIEQTLARAMTMEILPS